MSNKTNKATSNKATDKGEKPFANVPLADNTGVKVDGTPIVVQANAVTVEDKKPHVHVANSLAPAPVVTSEGEYTIGNKRAYACAMLTVCLAHCHGDKGKAIALCVKLLSYGNIGYSKQKQHMLKGNEVTATGMPGYCPYVPKTGAIKPWASKLLPKGDDYTSKTATYEKVCKHILATYGPVHGSEAMALVSKPTA